MSFTILTAEQRSELWHDYRRNIFTASEFGDFLAEEKEVRLNVAEITALLQSQGIEPPKKALKPDLVALLPNAADLATWTQSTVNARKRLIRQKLAARFYTDPAFAGLAGSAWLVDLWDKKQRMLDNDPAVQRGIQLEHLARRHYEVITYCKVTEVGLCVHDSGGFGCSPDGIIYGLDPIESRGLEIKCPIPETHMEYLDAGTLPDQYRPQVHGSMAVTGLRRWDFMSFCPGLPPLLLSVEGNDYTDRMLAGLLSLVEEKNAFEAKLRGLWEQQNKTNETRN